MITENGLTEAIIDNQCGIDKFYKVADTLESKFNIIFTKKLNDLESYYWDFCHEKAELVLHYNIYMGVSIFPKASKGSTALDIQKITDLFNFIIHELDRN